MHSNSTLDGNAAAARIAYLASEVIAIYPITPASPMGELADQWASEGVENIWGDVPRVVEMQSEGGAAGAVHGSLQAGALTTTFTASQGLLLMVPNLYKIAGELTPAVIHIAARSVATHALSIFCDHSDVMAARGTGFGMLFSNSVQEAMDLALVSHAATLEARVPLLHIFDGFRTSHEIATIEPLGADEVRGLLNTDLIRTNRERALTPNKPVVRGTAQNPDVFFQSREAVNRYYEACPDIIQAAMDRLAKLVGRQYNLFEYVGDPEAERVIVAMGSAVGAAEEAIERLTAAGEKVGLLKVRLYRPWSNGAFLKGLPKTTRSIAVLDRTKEPGAIGEPLYLDVVGGINQGLAAGSAPFSDSPRIIGGRYGLSSKEFTPAMVKAVFDELAKKKPKQMFTVGIDDDVTHMSLPWDPNWSTEDPDTVRALFFGLGSDGTVGAAKNAIKIIGEETDHNAQGFFVYDSKKSGSVTVSHLRFGPRPIRSTYLIEEAGFISCSQFAFVDQLDIVGTAQPEATLLLNSPWGPEEVWDHLPANMQRQIIDKKLAFHVIDADGLAAEIGMGRRINMIMQTCFFALSGVLPREEAIARIKESIAHAYGKRGKAVVDKNLSAVDQALGHLHQVSIPAQAQSKAEAGSSLPSDVSDFVRDVTGPMIDGRGDQLPVSLMPVDGTFPVATTRFEKRNIGLEIPVWDTSICIQCGKCVMVCPHSVIRAKVCDPKQLEGAPPTLKSAKPRWREREDQAYLLQVSGEDCTGCALCVEVCPVKNKREVRLKAINMAPHAPLREAERANWDFFEALPDPDRDALDHDNVKDVQLLQPRFEFSGACSGCGETPYLRLMTQLFGDRTLIANATGCSSIYGGNLPTSPWTTDAAGRGPAWSNSLFEDNAEFGLGMRVSVDAQTGYARTLLARLANDLEPVLVQSLLEADQSDEAGVNAQRGRVVELQKALAALDSADALDLRAITDALVKKSVWIVGGDGWAYDIGYGGLDHVLASGLDVNILVLDTEVYSNTGGQMSKATPRGAVAKFAAGGKPSAKKDLAMMAMSYGSAYVARVAMGANDKQTLKAFREAEAWSGPSIIIAYSHCIAHGYDLRHGMTQQAKAVKSGHWPLFRYSPERARSGANPMQLDSKAPSLPLESYIYNETRYSMLVRSRPEAAQRLLAEAKADVAERWRAYEYLAGKKPASEKE